MTGMISSWHKSVDIKQLWRFSGHPGENTVEKRILPLSQEGKKLDPKATGIVQKPGASCEVVRGGGSSPVPVLGSLVTWPKLGSGFRVS